MSELRAEITANVWKVLVSPGQTVAADEELMILESMKMEIPLESPAAGRVAEIAVEPPQRVEEGDLVMRLEV